MAARHAVACTLATVLTCVGAWSAEVLGPAPAPPTAAARPGAAFATVGDLVISGADYQRALALAMRQKYYHATPPQAELARFQREVGDGLVNRSLLLQEAQRRAIQPDRESINAALARYEARYKDRANWAANRDRMLAAVMPQLERDSRLEQLERQVKTVPKPSEAFARLYYEQHPDLFTEPEQVKLRVILLRVDPSAAQAAWNAAHAEAASLHMKLAAGADFAELARLHSGDRSAARGGEMDYMHRGMLPEALHKVVDRLEPQQLAAPVQVLEGVAIVRLDDRRKAQLRSFGDVRERVAALWQRSEGDARWNALIAELRQGTAIRIDESHYGPPRSATGKPRAG